MWMARDVDRIRGGMGLEIGLNEEMVFDWG